MPGEVMGTKVGNRGDNGNTRIRFILLEADGNAADLQQIAQVITNAVRPTTTVIQQVMAPPVSPALTGNVTPQGNGDDVEFQPSVEIVDEGDSVTTSINKRQNRPKARRYPMPSVLDLDLSTGETPFVQYFQQKNPEDHSKRYLVIAAWLKEFRQVDEINDDHIYTCYRTLSLNTVADIGSVFRGCKKQGWFNPGSQRGWFAINHVGLNQVNSMSNGG
jgi:hypothetical protein